MWSIHGEFGDVLLPTKIGFITAHQTVKTDCKCEWIMQGWTCEQTNPTFMSLVKQVKNVGHNEVKGKSVLSLYPNSL